MRTDYSTVPVEVVEDWKHHPGTQHLVQQLRAAHEHWLGRLEQASANGHELTEVSGLGGRCAVLRQLIADIKEAKGAEPT